jgi:hypothetical protein
MGPATAALLAIAGVVYLLFGFHIFRVLVMLNAALFGAWIGAALGQRAGSTAAGLVLGAFTAAVLTWPLMKYAVAVMGGVCGAILGAALWREFSLDPGLAWAGALVGLIGLGLLSFILFRASIILYMSFQGSVMLVFGILGLVYKYQNLAPHINQNIQLNPFLLPMAIFIPAMLGLIFQQVRYPAQAAAPVKKA